MRYLLIILATVWMACNTGPSSENTTPVLADTTAKVTTTSDELIKRIGDLESRAFSESMELNDSVAKALLRSYQQFYTLFPRQPESPEMLFKASDIARGLGKYTQSIFLLTTLHDAYPNFERRDEAAFLIGFTYDNSLRDTVKAIESYQRVMTLYPQSRWSSEAEKNIRLLKMTEKQMIEFLKKTNGTS